MAKAKKPGVGHNSAPPVGQIKSFIERIERLMEERQTFTDDIRDAYTEAKAHGFDVKALRLVIRRRKMEADERAELDSNVELYEGIFG